MFCRRKTLTERLAAARPQRRAAHIRTIVQAIRVIRNQHDRFPPGPIGADRDMKWTWVKDLDIGDIHVHIYKAIRADLIEISRGPVRLVEYVDQHFQYGSMLGYNDMDHNRVSLGKVAQALTSILPKDE